MTDETRRRLTRVELVPDLSHCVQTRAKQAYAATMSRFMSGDSSPRLGQRLELLRSFLEEADFGRLRRESEEHLTQGRKVKFILAGSAGSGKWSARMIVEDPA